MKLLIYPVVLDYDEGKKIYKVVDFPEITCSDTDKKWASFFLYTQIEDKIYDLACDNKPIPEPTVVPKNEQENYIYITVPYENKRFYWSKDFMDRCIGSAVISTFLMLGSTRPPVTTALLWLLAWLLIFIVLSVVSLGTFSLQAKLSFEKVSLLKRLVSIVGISFLAAIIAILMSSASPD